MAKENKEPEMEAVPQVEKVVKAAPTAEKTIAIPDGYVQIEMDGKEPIVTTERQFKRSYEVLGYKITKKKN